MHGSVDFSGNFYLMEVSDTLFGKPMLWELFNCYKAFEFTKLNFNFLSDNFPDVFLQKSDEQTIDTYGNLSSRIFHIKKQIQSSRLASIKVSNNDALMLILVLYLRPKVSLIVIVFFLEGKT